MANGFRIAGHDVHAVDTSRINQLQRGSFDWVYQKSTGRRFPAALKVVERKIQEAVRENAYDILFCYKTIHLDQLTILNLPISLKIHYSADDVSNASNLSRSYLAYEKEWSAIITTKRHNVPEIEARGGKPFMVMSAYDPAWHHPHVRLSHDEFVVGFVGNKRPDRADLIRRLGQRYGSRMIVSGPGWRSDAALRRTGVRLGSGAYGQGLAATISSIAGNLVLLNSDNRDTHTCRSFEVPACGGLFIGPRTQEHESLLTDGHEAYFYSSEDELIEILGRIEREPEKARRTAAQGYSRISLGKHAYEDRAREILHALA